jgi:hypothetical protein
MRTRTFGVHAALIAMALSVSSPGSAVAKPDSAAVTAIVAACSTKGAFGETFGATSLAGAPGRRMVDSRAFTPKAAYPPLEMFVANLTPNSERVAAVTAIAQLADEGAALDWGRAILEATSQDPQQLSFEDAGAPHEPGAPSVTVRGAVLEVSCRDLSLLDVYFDEMKQEPRLPHLIEIAPPPSDVCARPEARAALLDGFEETLGQYNDNQIELSRYILRLTGWRTQKQEEFEWNSAWQDTLGPAARSAARRAKAAYTLFEGARDGHDDSTACAAAVQMLVAADESYRTQLAHLDARKAEIEALLRSGGKAAEGSKPNP